MAATISALACLAAGWIAAGSVGMLDDTLGRALMWAALALALFADRAFRPGPRAAAWVLVLGMVVVAALAASRTHVLNVLAAALLAALLAPSRDAPARRVLVTVAQALVVLAVWRMLVSAAPTLWVAAARAGRLVGQAGSAVTDRPLRTGATFGGVDFIVTMLALLAGYLPAMRRRRVLRGLMILTAMAAGHLAYLAVLAFSPDIVSALPEPSATGWGWAGALGTLVPWNLPALAAGLNLAIAAAMIRWSTWPTEANPTACSLPAEESAGAITPHDVATNGTGPDGAPSPELKPAPASRPWPGCVLGLAATLFVAAALPFAAVFSTGPCGLAGKKFLALDSSQSGWARPSHDQPAGLADADGFGMLGDFVESLGGRWASSADISAAQLADANVLVVLEPNRPWQDGQLARIDEFVRGGGSLLVACSVDANGACNELLDALAVRLRPGRAVSAVGGWAAAVEAMSHPTTVGIGGGGRAFGSDGRASLELRLPAGPILIGRWGWADAADAGGTGEPANGAYDAGEKLGDLVMAAEEKAGRGTVVALADGRSLTNLATVRSHAFAARLLGYLAARPAGPDETWRQVALLAAGAVLVLLLVGRAGAFRPVAAAVFLGAGLWVATQTTAQLCQPLPDGRARTPNNLAYIDASHLGDFSARTGDPAALDELELALMRSGMLAMSMERFDARRLERAGVLISVAPQRAFSADERKALTDFVRGGGVFICLAGWRQRQAASDMLADFGLAVGETPPPDANDANAANAPAPQPLGRLRAGYVVGDDKPGEKRRATVHFRGAWPVAGAEPQTRVLVKARRGKAVVVMSSFGQGKVVLIGDPTFAANRHLAVPADKPSDANRQNVEFWRWLLATAREPAPASRPTGTSLGRPTLHSSMGETPVPLTGETPVPLMGKMPVLLTGKMPMLLTGKMPVLRFHAFSSNAAGPAAVTKNVALAAAELKVSAYLPDHRSMNVRTLSLGTRAQTLPPKPAPDAEAATAPNCRAVAARWMVSGIWLCSMCSAHCWLRSTCRPNSLRPPAARASPAAGMISWLSARKCSKRSSSSPDANPSRGPATARAARMAFAAAGASPASAAARCGSLRPEAWFHASTAARASRLARLYRWRAWPVLAEATPLAASTNTHPCGTSMARSSRTGQ